MAEQPISSLSGGDSMHPVQRLVLGLGLVGVMLICVYILVVTERARADGMRAARTEWVAFRDANCKMQGRATQATLQYGVDPRADAKLTLYKCRDGTMFATTRAFESQIDADLNASHLLDSGNKP
jgi:hypothetical protein